MNEQERAEEHLKTIRRLMERATIYRAISAPTALVGGLLSLIASGVWLTAKTPTFEVSHSFLFLWLAVLLLTAVTNALFIVLGAKRRNEPVFSASMKAAFRALAPAFIVAACLTLGDSGPYSDSLDGITLSTIWAICYGLGLLATSHFAPRSLMLMGWAFLGAGLVTILAVCFNPKLVFLCAFDGDYLGSLFMALTFGLFHLIYAACAWPRKGGTPEL